MIVGHVFKEANLVADKLAKAAHGFQFGVSLLDSPMDVYCNELRDDFVGVAFPRSF